MVSPKEVAWSAEVNPAPPVAPPRERVTIFPLDWQVSISDATNEQSGRFVSAKIGESTVLQIYPKRWYVIPTVDLPVA